MQFDDVNIDQVFNEYAKIMQDEGHLNKQANYTVPDFVVGNQDYTEVETQDVLRRLAGEKLYELDSEDLFGSAHPEGSTKIVDAPDGLGEVETIEAAQKKIQDIAEKKVTLARKVIALTNELDKDGFAELAKELDEKLAVFLGQGLPEKKANQAEQLIVQLSDLVGGAFTESNMLTDHYRDALNQILSSIAMSPKAAELREFPKQYYKFLEHMWARPEGRAVAQNMHNIYNDVVDVANQAVAALGMHSEPDSFTEEQALSKEDDVSVEMGEPRIWPESQKPVR